MLSGWEVPWARTSVVAEAAGQLVGFLGAEIDESLQRAWLHGPAVTDIGWDDTADALLDELHDVVPQISAMLQELVGDVANELLGHFAARHGFVGGSVHHMLGLDAVDLRELDRPHVPPLESRYEPAFLALHEQLFPGTYYSGQQLLDQAALGDAILLGLAEAGALLGYAVGRIDEGGDGYVDFVGVAPESRRQGHGTMLVAALAHELDSRASVDEVLLTVSSENEPALAAFRSLGFTQVSSAVGYRRSPESAD